MLIILFYTFSTECPQLSKPHCVCIVVSDTLTCFHVNGSMVLACTAVDYHSSVVKVRHSKLIMLMSSNATSPTEILHIHVPPCQTHDLAPTCCLPAPAHPD